MLNRQQQEAVKYNYGPLLIIAGAGTGKTSTLVEKIKHLITNKLAGPEEILALTFTEKAAAEMEERVDRVLPYGCFQTWILTFHAFADQVLRQEISQIGISPSYRLLTQTETLLFLKKHLFLLPLKHYRPLGNPDKFLEGLLQHFSRLRDEDVNPKNYRQWLMRQKLSDLWPAEEKEKYKELSEAYSSYQKLKLRQEVFDFADLISYLLQLFRQRQNVLGQYQRQFRFVLIDEFQDTNIAQYELIKLLCPPEKRPKLTVVGDDSQAIYKFRGASVSNLMGFIRDYPQVKKISLIKNYRSIQSVLDCAYRLIRHNDPDTLEVQLGISKKLEAKNKTVKKQPPKFSLFAAVEDEADAVAQTIRAMKSKRQFADFAILVRANDHAWPFQRSLSRMGIPYQFFGPGILFRQPEVKDLIAYLQWLIDIEDSVSFYRVLSMSIFQFSPLDLARLAAFAKKINRCLFEAGRIYLGSFTPTRRQEDDEIYQPYLPLLTQTTKGGLPKLYTILTESLSQLKYQTAGQILYDFIEKTGYLRVLSQVKSEKEEKIAANIAKFFTKIGQFENRQEDNSVAAVVEFIKLSLISGDSPAASVEDLTQKNAVNILTVHSAKGLEFPVVFMVNLTQGRFPTYGRRETIPIPDGLIKETLPAGNPHLLEERRLFYVGLTRAQEKVFLSAPLSYTEGKRRRKISQFVAETLGEIPPSPPTTIKLSTHLPAANQIYNIRPEKKENATETRFLSFSQLETYEICPLRYRYQYVISLPVAPEAASSFGDTIHRSLKQFYSGWQENQSLSRHQLIEIYNNNWASIGYTLKEQERRYRVEGKKLLSAFYQKYHPPQNQILALEKPFKIKINSQLYLTGKIDRIDSDKKGNIEIVDYKTGKQPAENEMAKNLQLAIYTYAAHDKHFLNRPLSKISVSFIFLQTGKKITLKKTAGDLVLVKKKLTQTTAEISNRHFQPQPGKWCDFCPFRIICEAWQ